MSDDHTPSHDTSPAGASLVLKDRHTVRGLPVTLLMTASEHRGAPGRGQR
jgi:hypothetical protein